MRPASKESNEWVDGFLFVGNRLILDFLNTKPVLADGPAELLPDAHALERWLIAAGLLASPRAKNLPRSWRGSAAAAAFLRDLTAFRENLREAVLCIESGSVPADAFLAEINALLVSHPLQTTLRKRSGSVVREVNFEPQKPSDFWAPIVDAAADLLSETETSRIRKCESCVLHFFDTSKKGSRRWCSMNICGNKIKVAAYQQRKRDQQAIQEP
ncbi:CGNR zinc finger domain-containing protein [Acidicapsa dinghuensis]|uniref:CGNR zinc finger domain-containing protein n=1 Tax=Acidicapsa dinghuensis TaxID=2218256 RepID=A0ABW1EA16_9BACT|nr:CGNR zinc finger domain-containing protein [Acidicapsa dinghuensis]